VLGPSGGAAVAVIVWVGVFLGLGCVLVGVYDAVWARLGLAVGVLLVVAG
jgi:hypothetical protein